MSPATQSEGDRDAARRIDGLQNHLFLDPILVGGYPADVLHDLGEKEWFAANPSSDAVEIATPIDFLGINYYSRHTVAAGAATTTEASSYPGSESVRFVETGAPRTQMGWPIHPDGLVDVLELAHTRRPDLPLYITGNGAAYEDIIIGAEIVDEERRRYFEQHLAACSDALRRGLALKGYFAWGLIDNFEWAWGYTRRFGLVYVDYTTQLGTVKHSGRWFGNFLAGRAAASDAELSPE